MTEIRQVSINLEPHPLSSFFPRMEGEEFQALVQDISIHGLRQPLILLDGLVLDGGNRLRACREAGVTPLAVDYDGNNPVAYVLSQNLQRRHLTPGQRAAIVSAAQDWSQAHPIGRMEEKGPRGPFDESEENQQDTGEKITLKDRAGLSGAGIRTQKRADKLAKEGTPELVQEVTQGKKSLPTALKELKGAEKIKKQIAIADETPAEYRISAEEQAENEALEQQAKEKDYELGMMFAEVSRSDDKLGAALETIRLQKEEITYLEIKLAKTITSLRIAEDRRNSIIKDLKKAQRKIADLEKRLRREGDVL